jgi:ADP-ribosylglycohydrolase
MAEVRQESNVNLVAIGITDPTVSLYSATDGMRAAELTQPTTGRLVAVGMGREPVSAWDQFVKGWRSRGGNTIRRSNEADLKGRCRSVGEIRGVGMDTHLARKAHGCILGGAVGDALGGVVEGRSAEAILEHYGGPVDGFVEPWQSSESPRFRRGDGRITDDTLMVLALASVYVRKGGHLTAFDMASDFMVETADTPTWIPELDAALPIMRRLAPAEQWLLIRLRHAHADPREAGVGNVVNCGAAMYMAPVGIVNAGDPVGAYAEAMEIAGAHQWSYGREAAGVMAAAVAAAMRPGATVDAVIAACLQLANDGTRAAIEAVVAVARQHSDWRAAIAPLRAAMAPYCTVGEVWQPLAQLGAFRASRLHSIEEVPVALGMLVVARGEFVGTVLGGVNYGRDCDSIAGMGGAIAGALGGVETIPPDWHERVSRGSRKDFATPARGLAAVATALLEHDRARWEGRDAAMRALTENAERQETEKR